jgi:hypothetical protein
MYQPRSSLGALLGVAPAATVATKPRSEICPMEPRPALAPVPAETHGAPRSFGETAVAAPGTCSATVVATCSAENPIISSRWPGLNGRPTVYETVALPLSYSGKVGANWYPRQVNHASGRGREPAGARPWPFPLLSACFRWTSGVFVAADRPSEARVGHPRAQRSTRRGWCAHARSCAGQASKLVELRPLPSANAAGGRGRPGPVARVGRRECATVARGRIGRPVGMVCPQHAGRVGGNVSALGEPADGGPVGVGAVWPIRGSPLSRARDSVRIRSPR